MNNVYFITGFPGFLATRLLKELTLQYPKARYRLLVLGSEWKAASAVIKDICPSECDIELIQGDITKADLGIDRIKASLLQQEVSHAFHLAALYDLTASRGACEVLNVQGTKNVTDWLKACPLLMRYSYFSTAYVSGKRQGVIKEEELIQPNEFRNHYEETKFLAEKIVHEARSHIPVTIFRPGIVTGDSESGETQKFDGPYYLLTFLKKLRYFPVL
ncbi:SDR family oxidoreductase [Fictibacillus iocasae]|uniref:SDR family oxidoreductase n=1 Tax=Fictibacillus iocasae TaxID=2715437 RepID=A0ABW2NN11_9BACL